MAEEISAALKRFPCFEGLGDHEAGALGSLLEPVHLAPGQVLFRQGDPGDALYLLGSGRVEVRITVPGRGDHVCATLEPGAIFGEISPLLDEPRTATVAATTDAKLWRIARADLLGAWARGDRWANQFLLTTAQTLARRLTTLNRELVLLIEDLRTSETDPQAANAEELEALCSRLFNEELLGLVKRSMV